MAIRIFAAIDVGSYELAMKIFEFSTKGEMRELEHIRHRIELGTDTYHTGKINQSRVDELCRVLNEFSQIMKSYKVDAYKAYGTSAIRETQNTVIVTEQIKLRTGIEIGVLSNSEQRFLHYKAAALKGDNFRNFISKSCAIVDIGGGSIQISLFEKDSLVTTQNIRLGVLRMMDMLSMLRPNTRDYENVLGELIDNQLNSFRNLYLCGRKIENIILIDDYISSAMYSMGSDSRVVSSDEFKMHADRLRNMGTAEVASKYGMAEEYVDMLVPSAAIVESVLKITKAKAIWSPGVSLCEGIAYEYAENEKIIKNSHDFENDIVACAVAMSKRYMGDKDRNDLLLEIADEIFIGTRKIHGMSKRDRLLLKIAAILNDCGKYISIEAAAECAYGIIMATEIIGLSHNERCIVANVVKFNKIPFEYYDKMATHTNFTREEYLRIAKLTAIFRVADGVCRSYRNKITGIHINHKNNELVITADSGESIVLEQSFFYRKSTFFEEVFAIRPVLKAGAKNYKTL